MNRSREGGANPLTCSLNEELAWLAEVCFAVMDGGGIRRGVFKSVSGLQHAVISHIRDHNRTAKPFTRTKPAETVLGKLVRLPIPSV